MVWHDLSPQAPPLLDRAGKGLRFYAPKANLLYRDINAVRGNSERLRTMRDFLIHRSRAGDLDECGKRKISAPNQRRSERTRIKRARRTFTAP